MDVFALVKVCARRWYVLLPLLALAAALAVVQGRTIKPVYSQSGSVIIVPPPTASVSKASAKRTQAVNPLGNVRTVQIALQSKLASTQAAIDVADKAGGSFSAAAQKAGGILVLSASAPSAAGTAVTLTAALNESATQLKALQLEVKAPLDTYFRQITLRVDGGVGVSYPHRSRNIVLVAVAGALISVLLVQLLDVILVGIRRRRARHRRPRPGADNENHAAGARGVSGAPKFSLFDAEP